VSRDNVSMAFQKSNPTSKKSIRNPKEGLVRYQFMEVLVRMVFYRYISHKGGTYKDGLKRLLEDYILPFGGYCDP